MYCNIMIIKKKLPLEIISRIFFFLQNKIALEAAFYKVWLGDTDPDLIHCENMVFPEYWGQSYISGPKQMEILGYVQTHNICTFEELFKEAKKKYGYIN